MTIKVLFLGDIVGEVACELVTSQIPQWRQKWGLDCVVVNGENAANNGFGITPEICSQLYAAGVDCITTGNHIWGKHEIIPHIKKDSRLLRPINYPEHVAGQGSVILKTSNGANILIINVMLHYFMPEILDNPFEAIKNVLQKHKLGHDVNAIVIDVHGEATSEKMAMGHMCDGKASLVIGTHTHIPTADYHIMENGTAYQTDAGMCGSYNSVIGSNKEMIVKRFTHTIPKPRIQITNDANVTLAGLYVEINKKTGLALRVEQVIFGGVLRQSIPI